MLELHACVPILSFEAICKSSANLGISGFFDHSNKINDPEHNSVFITEQYSSVNTTCDLSAHLLIDTELFQTVQPGPWEFAIVSKAITNVWGRPLCEKNAPLN